MFEWLSKQLQSTLILRPNQTCALQQISRCLLYYARETTKESVRFKWPLRKDRVINKDKLDITKTNRHKEEKKEKKCYKTYGQKQSDCTRVQVKWQLREDLSINKRVSGSSISQHCGRATLRLSNSHKFVSITFRPFMNIKFTIWVHQPEICSLILPRECCIFLDYY